MNKMWEAVGWASGLVGVVLWVTTGDPGNWFLIGMVALAWAQVGHLERRVDELASRDHARREVRSRLERWPNLKA